MTETKYYIPTIEEADKFVTYDYELHPMSDKITKFYKKSHPDYCNVPSENKHTIKKQKLYFDLSNMEDLLVLEMEHNSFLRYYKSEKDSIERGE